MLADQSSYILITWSFNRGQSINQSNILFNSYGANNLKRAFELCQRISWNLCWWMYNIRWNGQRFLSISMSMFSMVFVGNHCRCNNPLLGRPNRMTCPDLKIMDDNSLHILITFNRGRSINQSINRTVVNGLQQHLITAACNALDISQVIIETKLNKMIAWFDS